MCIRSMIDIHHIHKQKQMLHTKIKKKHLTHYHKCKNINNIKTKIKQTNHNHNNNKNNPAKIFFLWIKCIVLNGIYSLLTD